MPTPTTGPLAPHLAAITFGVRDIDASVAFYSAVGLSADVRSDGRRAWFQLNGLALCLVQRGHADPELGPGTPGEGRVAVRHAVTESRAIEAILVAVTRAGGRVLRAPAALPWGGRGAWFCDLDGHRWEVVYDPALRRDAHGGAWLPPRERLDPLPDAFDDEPFTDDLGDALETAEEPRDPAAVEPWLGAERPTVLAEPPTFVEPFVEEDTPDLQVESDVEPTVPTVRPTPAPLPEPMSRRLPQPRPLPEPRPAPSSAASAERSALDRAVRVGVLVAAFLGGSGMAWALLKVALP